MAIRQTSSGSWQWDLKLTGWTGRQRATFKTQAEAEAHDLQTQADHKLGRPYKAPTHTSSVATRAQTISDLVEHCWKVQWSQQKSARPDPDRPWQRHPQYRNAELFADWCGPKTPASDVLHLPQGERVRPAPLCRAAQHPRDHQAPPGGHLRAARRGRGDGTGVRPLQDAEADAGARRVPPRLHPRGGAGNPERLPEAGRGGLSRPVRGARRDRHQAPQGDQETPLGGHRGHPHHGPRQHRRRPG